MYKIFFWEIKDGKKKKSSNIKKFKDLCNHKNILNEEIEAFNPNLIVLFGNDVYNPFKKLIKNRTNVQFCPITKNTKTYNIQNVDEPVFPMVHLSGAASGYWNQFIIKNNWNPTKEVGKDYAQIIINKIDEIKTNRLSS